jgi:integrase
LYEVKKLLAHKTIAITMRYTHLAPRNLEAAVNSLDKMEGTAIVGADRSSWNV